MLILFPFNSCGEHRTIGGVVSIAYKYFQAGCPRALRCHEWELPRLSTCDPARPIVSAARLIIESQSYAVRASIALRDQILSIVMHLESSRKLRADA
jgi:hypothetical protein